MATISLSRPIVLALNLNEQFVSTDSSARGDLSGLLDASQEQIHLVYMSHANAEKIIQLAAESQMPISEVVLADSGTTALKGDGSGTIEPLQRNIIQLWPGKEAVSRIAKEIDGVELAPDDAPCRQAVKVSDETALEKLHSRADDIGCHVQDRGNGQHDILPFGVDKGSTLGRWLVQENLPPNQVIAFGGSMGDTSLFGRGWRGAIFPTSPEALVADATRFHNVFRATQSGPGGVLETLRHFGWLDTR